jgi:Domain of unknown function (DUF4399)
MNRWLVAGTFALLAQAAVAQTPAPEDALLYIISPKEGQRIKGPFWVQFGLRNMGVTRAGDTTPNVGHHHLLVNADAKDLDLNAPIPTDRRHLHFGGGQTETRLDLPPGKHTLQLVLGDAEHKLFKPLLVSQKVAISVLDPSATPPRKAKNKRSRSRTR